MLSGYNSTIDNLNIRCYLQTTIVYLYFNANTREMLPSGEKAYTLRISWILSNVKCVSWWYRCTYVVC